MTNGTSKIYFECHTPAYKSLSTSSSSSLEYSAGSSYLTVFVGGLQSVAEDKVPDDLDSLEFLSGLTDGDRA